MYLKTTTQMLNLGFLHQNWMAYESYPSVWDAKESSEIIFSENEVSTAQNNYAVCKVRIHSTFSLMS